MPQADLFFRPVPGDLASYPDFHQEPGYESTGDSSLSDLSTRSENEPAPNLALAALQFTAPGAHE